MSKAQQPWWMRLALWMAERNGRSVARRIAFEGKRYSPHALEKELRERLTPLVAGMDPTLQKILTDRSIEAAKDWLARHEKTHA